MVRRGDDIFTLRVFGGDLVLVSTPELVRELVTAPAGTLAAGKANAILAPAVGSASLLLLDGDEHLRMRRVMLPPLHGDRMRAYEQTMREIAEASVARWPLDGPVVSWPRMQQVTLDVIVRVIFGIDDAQRAAPVREAVRRLLHAATSRRLLLSVATISAVRRRRPTQLDVVLRSVLRRRDELAALLDAQIRDRRRQGDGDRGDALSLLLSARDEDDRPLPDSLVRDQLITLLVAGHETTATSLAWVVERIAHLPELQERLAAEALDGRHELIDATIKETLRMRPALPLFLRQAQRDFSIGGYDLPPGTMIGGATLMMHRRPDLYPDPLTFRPERFLGDDTPGTYEWVPFGGGVRRCIGASFALLEMRVVLAALLAERQLAPAQPVAEKIRRRAIVLAPEHGGRVLAPRRRRVPARPGRPKSGAPAR